MSGRHRKPTTSALKHIGTVLVAAPLALGFGTAVANADSPGGKGIDSVEDQSTGTPDNPNGFGAVSSQLATTLHGIGGHTSRFAPGQNNDDGGGATGRLGVGNVSSNDGNLITDANPGPDDGARRHPTG